MSLFINQQILAGYHTEHVTIYNGISSALRELKSSKRPLQGVTELHKVCAERYMKAVEP